MSQAANTLLKYAIAKTLRGEFADTIGGGSSDAQREGDAIADPEDFPLGKACNPMGDEPCDSCQ